MNQESSTLEKLKEKKVKCLIKTKEGEVKEMDLILSVDVQKEFDAFKSELGLTDLPKNSSTKYKKRGVIKQPKLRMRVIDKQMMSNKKQRQKEYY